MNIQIRRCPPSLSEAFSCVLATVPYVEQIVAPTPADPFLAESASKACVYKATVDLDGEQFGTLMELVNTSYGKGPVVWRDPQDQTDKLIIFRYGPKVMNPRVASIDGQFKVFMQLTLPGGGKVSDFDIVKS